MGEEPSNAILVVDDDEPIVKNMRRVLKRKGFNKVVSALNGEQGIKLLEDPRNHFFLIMSDQRMPGMSGSEFLTKSILLSPESRRMLVTGYSDFEAIIDAVNKGEIHQYISKPWNNDDLLLRIMGEQAVYNKFQERKRMYKMTQIQNKKLFDLAVQQKKNLQKFTTRLEEKKEQVEYLIQELKDAKETAEFKETFPGLDELLSRTITMNQTNLVEAFRISKGEIREALSTIARRNKVGFGPEQSAGGGTEDISEDVFDIIDQVIENAVQAVEPKLFAIGSEPDTGVVTDDYREVPEFDTLAFNDGYITKGEMEKAREELETRESDQPSGLTIDKMLITKGYLQRKDLSRIFAKLSLIETRLLDREFADMLLEREIITKKDADRAFRKQLNNFEDSGVTALLADLLVEADVIAKELADEVMADQDRSGGRKKKQGNSAEFSAEFGAFVDLQVSEDRVQAWIRAPKTVQGTTDIAPIKKLIKKRGIKYGIVKDREILHFLRNCTDPAERFVVAQGIPASVGKPAEIVYHFKTEQDAAGVVREDGSIDFTSRGESAFVKKGGLLAEKIPMEHPKSGRDIFGETLLVGEVDDVSLKAGDGVMFSEDQLKLYAALQGQPSLNAKGEVSVLEQFTVKGDVDFKTGNIKFSGNVLVTGAVREGFIVECEALTANEINGATILIQGDLKVSNGIVNAYIETQGSIQAKFLNQARIFAHGNVMITREIMESKILVSGELKNETGRITASKVAARLGMSVKQIGTEKAEASVIKAGAEDHILWVEDKFNVKIANLKNKAEQAIERKKDLDEDYNSLHVDIANQTFAQEKLTKKMDFVEKQIGKAGSPDEKKELVRELNEIEQAIETADQRIKGIFEDQDRVMQKVEAEEKKIAGFNNEIKALTEERDLLVRGLRKEDPIPLIKVNKKAFRYTRIMGTSAAMMLQNDMGASKFMEIDTDDAEAPKQIVFQPL